MRGARAAPITAVLAMALVVVSVPAQAASPQRPSWGDATLEGPPVAVGFVSGGRIVYGTGDAGSVAGSSGAACSIQDGDADLFVFSFPRGPGCLDAVDTSGTELGREGIISLTAAKEGERVVVGLAPSSVPEATPVDLVAYDVEDGNLTQAYTRDVGGPVLLLASDPTGSRVMAAVQTDPNPGQASYRLAVLDEDGRRETRSQLRGLPSSIDVSTNGRYVAIGGNYTSGNTTFGWAHLYDLSQPEDENPVLSREFRRARGGVVTSVAVTAAGALYAGHADGQLTFPRADATDLTIQVGNGTTSVDAHDGIVAAAAGSTVLRLSGQSDALRGAWNATLAGTVAETIVHRPYIFVRAGDLTAFSPTGATLWSVPGGAVVAPNGTALGLAVGQRGSTQATGTQTSTLTARQLHRSAQISLADAPPTISPGGIAITNITIRNDGAAILDASLTSQGSEDVRIRTAPERFTLLPGRNRTIQATISVGHGASPGAREIPVTLSSRPSVDSRANLTIDVGTRTNVTVALEPGTIDDPAVSPGQDITTRFIVDNDGNADVRVRVSLEQAVSRGSPWEAELSPSGTITIPQGTRTTVRLDATVPQDARDGTVNRMVVRATTSAGSTAASITFTVNPFQALSLEPQSITKQIAPGDTVSYDFRVRNLGSVPANVSIDAQALNENGTAYVPADWGIVLDRSQARIRAGASAPVTLELTAPANGTTGESLRVQLLATSAQGARTSSIAYGFVDASLAGDDEQPKRDPLPVLLPLSAIVLAGLALRRWRYGNV